MKLAKYRTAAVKEAVGILEDDHILPLDLTGAHFRSLTDLLEADDPVASARLLIDSKTSPLPLSEAQLLAPIDGQEVWAAGVTYKRSRAARMEESEGAASFYDKVYAAARPELFFKASPARVSGPGMPVRIRRDARWNVPEPELTLVLNSRLRLVGYTIGNDMSSRDIEGENPLYLPQAKVYNQCCGLGPCIALPDRMPPREEIGIRLKVLRDGETAFEGTTIVDQMARTFQDLIEYLGRDNSFPNGVYLLTGTGIVPSDDFTLFPGDIVEISIDGIGTLQNPVVQG